jgi:hypothetical protein
MSLSVGAQLCCCNKHPSKSDEILLQTPFSLTGQAHSRRTGMLTGVQSWNVLQLLERKQKAGPGSENFHPGHRPCLRLLPWPNKAYIHFLASLHIERRRKIFVNRIMNASWYKSGSGTVGLPHLCSHCSLDKKFIC